RRSPALRFLGGWHAFPGGGLARSDAAVAVAGAPAGTSETTYTDALPGLADDERRRLGPDLIPGITACALRELFEETGLVLAPGVAADSELAAARRRLLADEIEFGALVAERGWNLSAAPLVFAGRWLTPPLWPTIRYDNRFFLLEWPADRTLQPEVVDGELDHGEWIRPAAALQRWEEGEMIAAPPILHILRVLSEVGPQAGLARLRDPGESNLGPYRRLEFRPGVILLPLLSPTLPPAATSNAFLLGREEVVLIDPGTPWPEEIDRLEQAVAAVAAQGRKLRAIWLTHHHPDHVGGAAEMRRRLGVPVLAHRLAAELLKVRGIAVDGELDDGERVELGGDPPFAVRVLHTPGHTRGHLSFWVENHRSLLAGDLVSGMSTVVIDPPEGNMDDYLGSLERMIKLRPGTIFPAHGPPMLEAVEKLAELRDHRLWREEKINAVWRAGVRTPRKIVREVYTDVPKKLHPMAERQVLAHLERLRRIGKIDSVE
ncbi:MAG: MBL fold metallo-hydrolase, partial [bacterium]|nr:MBL fold metallo-hydrolase [bacterium]